MPRPKTSTTGRFAAKIKALATSAALQRRMRSRRTTQRRGKAERATATDVPRVTQRSGKQIYSGSDGSCGDVSNSEEEDEDLLGGKDEDHRGDEEEEPLDSPKFDEEEDDKADKTNGKDDDEELLGEGRDDEEEEEDDCRTDEKGLRERNEAFEFPTSVAGSSTQQQYVTPEMLSEALGRYHLMFSMTLASFEGKVDRMLQAMMQRLQEEQRKERKRKKTRVETEGTHFSSDKKKMKKQDRPMRSRTTETRRQPEKPTAQHKQTDNCGSSTEDKEEEDKDVDRRKNKGKEKEDMPQRKDKQNDEESSVEDGSVSDEETDHKPEDFEEQKDLLEAAAMGELTAEEVWRQERTAGIDGNGSCRSSKLPALRVFQRGYKLPFELYQKEVLKLSDDNVIRRIELDIGARDFSFEPVGIVNRKDANKRLEDWWKSKPRGMWIMAHGNNVHHAGPDISVLTALNSSVLYQDEYIGNMKYGRKKKHEPGHPHGVHDVVELSREQLEYVYRRTLEGRRPIRECNLLSSKQAKQIKYGNRKYNTLMIVWTYHYRVVVHGLKVRQICGSEACATPEHLTMEPKSYRPTLCDSDCNHYPRCMPEFGKPFRQPRFSNRE